MMTRSVPPLAQRPAHFLYTRTPLDSSLPTTVLRRGVNPRFSPDGRWYAVEIWPRGFTEVVIGSLADSSVRIQVSTAGGGAPAWSADGKTLYYMSLGRLLAARLATTPSGLRIVTRDTVLRALPAEDGNDDMLSVVPYAVSPDGRRVLMVTPIGRPPDLVVVPNWLTEFRERIARAQQR